MFVAFEFIFYKIKKKKMKPIKLRCKFVTTINLCIKYIIWILDIIKNKLRILNV